MAMTARHKRIPVTSPARTIVDLRRSATVDEVRRAIREAQFRKLDLHGAADLDRDLTRSELERRFLRLCRRHRLPLPEVNAMVGPYEVDFLWRVQRLVVETDGWRAHSGRIPFEEDRERDLELKLLGYEVIRLTYRHVAERPEAVARKLREILHRLVR
jgi:very-short-patch-repair endonuclease